jgi:hypothetical protein
MLLAIEEYGTFERAQSKSVDNTSIESLEKVVDVVARNSLRGDGEVVYSAKAKVLNDAV